MVNVGRMLAVMSKFLGGQWSSADEQHVTVRPITGYGNQLHVVELLTKDEQFKGPTKVLFRKFGHSFVTENDVNVSIGLMEQNLVYFHCSHIGLGPEIYGIYDQGRIEEYFSGRILTLQDYNNDLVSMDIARKLARFHCMKMPFERKPRDYVQMSQTMLDTLRKRNYNQYAALDSCRDIVDQLLQHDYEGDLAWVSKLLPCIPGAIAFCHHDLHNGNIMRLDQPNKNGDQAALLDFELSGYGLRGADLGYFFYFGSFDFGNETLLSGADYPSEQWRRSFIVQYLSECDRLGHSNGDLDCVSNVVREVEFYGILIALKSVLWLLTIEPILTTPSLAVKFMNMTKKLLDMSQERKRLFPINFKMDDNWTANDRVVKVIDYRNTDKMLKARNKLLTELNQGRFSCQ
ncbi:Choline/ethanolamine kinase [Halotydeus destructor]|nr:Choline/ethanolamine kinase [Halotydeus destructor]